MLLHCAGIFRFSDLGAFTFSMAISVALNAKLTDVIIAKKILINMVGALFGLNQINVNFLDFQVLQS